MVLIREIAFWILSFDAVKPSRYRTIRNNYIQLSLFLFLAYHCLPSLSNCRSRQACDIVWLGFSFGGPPSTVQQQTQQHSITWLPEEHHHGQRARLAQFLPWKHTASTAWSNDSLNETIHANQRPIFTQQAQNTLTFSLLFHSSLHHTKKTLGWRNSRHGWTGLVQRSRHTFIPVKV